MFVVQSSVIFSVTNFGVCLKLDYLLLSVLEDGTKRTLKQTK